MQADGLGIPNAPARVLGPERNRNPLEAGRSWPGQSFDQSECHEAQTKAVDRALVLLCCPLGKFGGTRVLADETPCSATPRIHLVDDSKCKPTSRPELRIAPRQRLRSSVMQSTELPYVGSVVAIPTDCQPLGPSLDSPEDHQSPLQPLVGFSWL
jgi:hypothetical protein